MSEDQAIYEVQYVVRSLGNGIPGRHNCTGCTRKFLKNEIFEIGSFYFAKNDTYIVVNVHKNTDCRDSALIAIT